jgi:hypothetical protein
MAFFLFRIENSIGGNAKLPYYAKKQITTGYFLPILYGHEVMGRDRQALGQFLLC